MTEWEEYAILFKGYRGDGNDGDGDNDVCNNVTAVCSIEGTAT